MYTAVLRGLCTRFVHKVMNQVTFQSSGRKGLFKRLTIKLLRIPSTRSFGTHYLDDPQASRIEQPPGWPRTARWPSSSGVQMGPPLKSSRTRSIFWLYTAVRAYAPAYYYHNARIITLLKPSGDVHRCVINGIEFLIVEVLSGGKARDTAV